MKCPNCGSEHIQYTSTTSGGGFHADNACCGMLLLGPLGLLCGACGSGSKSEDFWVCCDCGKKFDAEEARRKEEKALRDAENEYAYYVECKRVREVAFAEYGDIDNIIKIVGKTISEKDQADKAYQNEYDTFVQEMSKNDNNIKKLAKKTTCSDRLAITILVLLILGVALLFCGLFPVGAALIGALIIYVLIVGYSEVRAKDKLTELFLSKNISAKDLQKQKAKAHEEHKKWEEITRSIDYCEKYEKEHPDKV